LFKRNHERGLKDSAKPIAVMLHPIRPSDLENPTSIPHKKSEYIKPKNRDIRFRLKAVDIKLSSAKIMLKEISIAVITCV